MPLKLLKSLTSKSEAKQPSQPPILAQHQHKLPPKAFPILCLKGLLVIYPLSVGYETKPQTSTFGPCSHFPDPLHVLLFVTAPAPGCSSLR